MKRQFVICLSEMTDFDRQRPTDEQRCSLAILSKSGELVRYQQNAKWKEKDCDWFVEEDSELESRDDFFEVPGEWVCVPHLNADAYIKSKGVSIYWSSAPCPS